ncbi:MAG: methyltransferase [Micrococcaceae bacterium]
MQNIVELEIGNVAHGGHFVARHEGRVIFVRHALPGEKVRALLTEAGEKAKFWRADAIEIIEPSPYRVQHIWPAADRLKHDDVPGGAEFGHIDLEYQRELKAQVITELLKRFAGIDVYVIVEQAPEDEERKSLHWRTRNTFAVNSQGQLSMYKHHSSQLIPVKEFPLAYEGLDDLGLFEYDFSGISQVEIGTPANDSEPVVLIKPAHPSGVMRGYVRDNIVNYLAGKAGVSYVTRNATASVVTRPNQIVKKRKAQNVTNVSKMPVEHASGKGFIEETVFDRSFKIGASGFWQVHREAPEVLVEAVLEAADVQEGQYVGDLYSGVGLFTAFIAEKVGEKGLVVAVESSKVTSKNARNNLHEFTQVRVIASAVERVITPKQRFDTVVLDPPRSGAGRQVINKIAQNGTQKVVYVACDPAAMARDISYLSDYGYELNSLRAFDIYPHTHHVECVAELNLV